MSSASDLSLRCGQGLADEDEEAERGDKAPAPGISRMISTLDSDSDEILEEQDGDGASRLRRDACTALVLRASCRRFALPLRWRSISHASWKLLLMTILRAGAGLALHLANHGASSPSEADRWEDHKDPAHGIFGMPGTGITPSCVWIARNTWARNAERGTVTERQAVRNARGEDAMAGISKGMKGLARCRGRLSEMRAMRRACLLGL